MSTVRGIDATYYTTADLERGIRFYSELLGMEPTVTMPGFVAEWTFADNTTFGLHHAAGYDGGQRGSVMFSVADVEAVMREAIARGVRFDDEDITDTPVCRMAFGRDPDDNQFILHQHKG
ncbi:MAG TPA: VOC family protein [Candidatus Aquilonibacter sp.]|nr:VOC family protein [Candidatus Aquilonibacter sp.]